MTRTKLLLLTLTVATLITTPASAADAPATRPAATQAATTQQAPAPAAAPPPVQIAARRVAAPLNIKAQREAQRQSVKSIPDGGAFKLDDLIRFRLVDGRLQCEWVADKFPPGQARRVTVAGDTATWVVSRFSAGPNPFHNVARYDFDAPESDFWMSQYSYQEAANITSVYAQGGETCEVTRMFFTQQPASVTFSLTAVENNRHRQILTATAPDLARLRSDHPDEVTRFLLPVLRRLTRQPILRPGAGDVYRVFTRIPADSDVTAAIEALLPDLQSSHPDRRDQATRKLHALGPAGALAALRFDRDPLLPEQSSRLAALIATHSHLTIDDPAQAARDPIFLIDALEHDDPAVRAAAKTALEAALNRPVPFDTAAPPDQRATAAHALRASLAKPRKVRLDADDFQLEVPIRR